MNEIVKEWVFKAEGDFRTANREIKVTDFPNYDAVCYHCEQCIEKLMKALLIKSEVSFDYTHNLLRLQEYLQKINPAFSFEANDLKFLTRAGVNFRYPGENAEKEEAVIALDITKGIRKKLISFIGDECFIF